MSRSVRRAALAGALFLLPLLTTACRQSSKACKVGTLFLTVQLDSASAQATTLDIDVAFASATKHGMVAHTKGVARGTVEVDFSGGYPTGSAATITVRAESGTTELGVGSQMVTFTGACQSATIAVNGPMNDLGVGDMPVVLGDGGGDGGSDAGTCTAGSCAAGLTCVDGVCCDTPCTGQCEACNVPGSVGTCIAATGAPVGGRQTCAAAGSICGGACDGTNRTGCAYPGAETNCIQQSCSGGTKTIAVACDGSGTCPVAQTVQCTPATCNAAGTDCASTCGGDNDCVSITGKPYCDHGACTVHKPVGRGCSGGTDCNSTFCIDGVCCDQACQGQCQACDINSGNIMPGTCSPVTSGAPHNVPASGRSACNGTGTCAGSCAAGQTQICTYPTTPCAGGMCTGGTLTPAVDCANGICPGTTTQPCPGNLGCTSNMCLMGSCASDGDCATGYFCATGGSCQLQLPQGSPCPQANCETQSNCHQCTTGQCVDGYCCDQACGGQCQACNLTPATGGATAKPGTCSTVGAGGAPVTPRTACLGATPCTGACNGTDPLACHYPTVACGPGQSCTGGVVTLPESCLNGSCVAPSPSTQTCGGVCSGNSCGNCTLDGDCGTGKYCNGGACVPTLGTGQKCMRATQCATPNQNCVDGYCCGTPCNTGPCVNCSDNPGVCSDTGSAGSPIQPIGTHGVCPGSSPCQEACNGSGASCADVNNGVTNCVPASCDMPSNTETFAANCAAGGTCPAPTTKSCAPYECSGTACATSCTPAGLGGDGQCTTSYCTTGGMCMSPAGLGAPCDVHDSNSCASGICLGGVCCNTLCNGGCGICTAATGGICTPMANGTLCAGISGDTCAEYCNGSSVSCPTTTNGYSCGPNYCNKCSNGSCGTTKHACGSSACCGGTTCCGSGCGCDTVADCKGGICQ